MKIFITGAHGFIGRAICSELISSGHTIVGLAHHDGAATALSSLGCTAHRGDLGDLESLRAGVQGCDGVIHVGFSHDFKDLAQFAKFIEQDREAVKTLGEALLAAGGSKVMVYAQGMISPGDKDGIQREDDVFDPAQCWSPRALVEIVARELALKGLKIAGVRLPTAVHGPGEKGMIPQLMAGALKAGSVGHIGDGANMWASVHCDDAAKLFATTFEALAKGTLPTGKSVHAIADKGIETKSIAESMAKRLGLKSESVSAEEMQKRAGFYGMAFGMNIRADNELTKSWTGWEPTAIGLLQDIEENYPAGTPAA